MTKRSKLLFTLIILFTLAILVPLGSVVYMYFHPAKTKQITVKLLSRSLSRKITTESLIYTFHPFHIIINDLRIYGPGEARTPELFLDEMDLKAFRSESFIPNLWQLEYIKIKGLKLSITPKAINDWLGTRKKTKPGFLNRLITKWFMNRIKTKFSVSEMSVTQSSLAWESPKGTVEAKNLSLTIGKSSVSKPGPVRFHLDSLDAKTKQGFHVVCINVEGKGKREIQNNLSFIHGNISSKKIKVLSPQLDVSRVSFSTDFSYSFPTIKAQEFTVTIPEESSLVYRKKPFLPLWGKISSSLSLDLAQKKVDVSALHMNLLGEVNINGQGTVMTEPSRAVSFTFLSVPIPLGSLVSRFSKFLPEPLRPLRFSGSWEPCLKGNVKIIETNGVLMPGIHVDFTLPEERLQFDYRNYAVACNPRGNMQFSFENHEGKFQGELFLDDGRITSPEFKSAGWSSSFSFRGSDTFLNISSFKMTVPPSKTGKTSLPSVEIEGDSRIDFKQKRIEHLAMNLNSSASGSITVQAHGGWKKPDKIEATLEGKEHNFGKLLKIYGVTSNAWKILGKHKLSLVFSPTTKNRWKLDGKWNLFLKALSDSNYKYAGEKIPVQVDFRSLYNRGNRDVLIRGKMVIPKGELMVKTYYINFGQYPFTLQFNSDFDCRKSELTIKQLKARLHKVISTLITGQIKLKQFKLGAFRFRMRIPETPVPPLFSLFVIEPFQDENPIVKSVETNGKMRVDLSIMGLPGNFHAIGKVFCRDIAVKCKGVKPVIDRIAGEIPLWINLSSKKKKPGRHKPISGGLKIKASSLPVLGTHTFELQFGALPNELKVKNSVKLKNHALDINIKPIMIKNLLSRDLEISTGLKINRLEVGEISKESLEFSQGVQGSFSGNLPRIICKGGNLKAKGFLTGKLFDGTVKISGIKGENIFSASRVLGADVDFRDLNLEKLTESVNFGRIKGSLDGYVHHLEVASGQPVAFDAVLETVRKKGIPQRINVKAVDNIAQLGSSGSPFQGMGKLVTMFFKEFGYEKIGIRCILKNDVFTVRGTVLSDHTEYLVKRRGFMGINVINRNPRNNISFEDMVKRIRRITKTSHPVIK